MTTRYDILKVDQRTVTGRIYPLEVGQQIFEEMRSRNVVVTAESFDTTSIPFDRIAGKIIEPEFNDGVLSAAVDYCNSPMGQLVQSCQGVEFEVSICGTGYVSPDGIISDYTFLCCFLTPKPAQSRV